MKISTWFIVGHFLGILIFLLNPVYESFGLSHLNPKETAYFGWALFFPMYLCLRYIEDFKEEGS